MYELLDFIKNSANPTYKNITYNIKFKSLKSLYYFIKNNPQFTTINPIIADNTTNPGTLIIPPHIDKLKNHPDF